MDETLLIQFLNADPFVSNEEAEQLRKWPRPNDNAAGVTPRRLATPSPIQRVPENHTQVQPTLIG